MPPVVFKPVHHAGGIRLGAQNTTTDAATTDVQPQGPKGGKPVTLNSGAGVAIGADGLDSPSRKKSGRQAVADETKPPAQPMTEEERQAAEAQRKKEAEEAAQAYERAITELTRAAAIEAFQAHLAGAAAPPADGALAELERVRSEMVAHGHGREAEQLGVRLAAQLEALLADTPNLAPLPVDPPQYAGPPLELIAMAHQAGDAVRPMLRSGRARQQGPGMSFYFPRDDQPAALVRLVRELNTLASRGEIGWAAQLQDEFMSRLGQ